MVDQTDEALFEVNDSFPKLTSDMLINGCPSGVDRVEYQINLDGFEDFGCFLNLS